jgi:C4-dicarboxylate-specific signal transduction histidine kinase
MICFNPPPKSQGCLLVATSHRVIEVGLQMTELRRKEDHVRVEYNSLPETIPVKMEMDRVVQVMVNLILNACDAMTGNYSKRMIVTVYRPEVSSTRPSVRLDCRR